ncbi:PTS sugar transporter subunit IIC [candidate division WOR-3 bacterium]|nr:PTS sugar transporter subunit IIC [candidate division WOR-3 bacterium]
MIAIGAIILGSLMLLDKFAFGEFGISQPIMAGTLLGMVFGDIPSGILVGAGLQLIFLGGLPIGRDIPPDGPAAGIIACSVFFIARPGSSTGQSLALALLLALIASIVGGALEIMARRFNDRLFKNYKQHPACVTRNHLLGLLTAFIRNVCTIAPFLLIASLVPIPEQFPSLSPEHFIIIGIGIGSAHALYLFSKRATFPYIVIGGLCGLALLVL